MELRKDSVPFQCKVDNILVLHEDLGFIAMFLFYIFGARGAAHS